MCIRSCDALLSLTCAQHPKEYPHQAGRWRSLRNSAIQSEVQLAGTCALEVATHFSREVATHFSRCCSIWESANRVAVALFHGGTLIFIQTWFSHLNAYASICALHLYEYSHDVLSRKCKPCCSSVVASAAAATLVFVVVSVCRAAASAAAAAARHALCLFFFFFVLHNAVF